MPPPFAAARVSRWPNVGRYCGLRFGTATATCLSRYKMAMDKDATVASAEASNSGPEYDHWLELVQRNFLNLGRISLFTTDTKDLWQLYLDCFHPEQKQAHNCSACRRFVQQFGGLVTIDDRGRPASVFWDIESAPSECKPGVAAMRNHVLNATVTGVFLSSRETWGIPVTGLWTHLAVTPHADMVYRGKSLTPGQAMAEKREDYKNVIRALQEFTPATIAQALSLLKSDALYRSEKVIGPAKWLEELHNACAKADRSNVVWRAVATAPAGFCHPRSSMTGTLLEDIASGMEFESVSRRFADKMHPLRYQRPQAAPSAGTIAQAEKLVEQLGIAKSFERRFARLDEIQTIWMSATEPKRTGGFFGHLIPKDRKTSDKMKVPPQVITWEKFARTVLEGAKSIDLMVPEKGSFTALVTAEHVDAPPILQWDSPECRNPFSWYMYVNGSSAKQWGLDALSWCRVPAVALKPSMWFGEHKHQGIGALFILDGAKDNSNNSACLFPETLKSELRPVRSVIEAYSKKAQLGGKNEASACGLLMGKESGVHVRVTNASGVQIEYKLDRWD